MALLSVCAAVFVLLSNVQHARGQIPLTPKYDKVIESKTYPGVKISYKAPGICETTPGVKSFSGYISIPTGSLEDYPINLFFWFFESRKDPTNAPLALWLNGGPGTSSMKGLFHGTGPCSVNADSKSTTLNPHSWNNEANMLYIDQPVQTGFSYDVLLNVTSNIMGKKSLAVGASQNAFQTANSTGNAAKVTWRFLQVFLGDFPEIKSKTNALSIWSTDYGGRWAPSFAAHFLRQSEKKVANEVPLKIDTIGIVNGFIDMVIQQPKFPLFGFNNTYGIQAVDEGVYKGVTKKWATEDGCGTNLIACRAEAAKCDADNTGTRGTCNAYNLCAHSSTVCSTVAGGYTLLSKQSVADVTQKRPSTFPAPYYVGYLNSQKVQQALGVPRNFTEENLQANVMFTGYDALMGGHLENIGYLLDRGINVALAYGDRDYSNNWLGGEAISLAVKYKDSATFKAAGYQDLKVNTSYVGGLVRQVGRLSFTRVFDAGQEAYAYQPQALSQIFQRTLSSKDIATGSSASLDATYKTSGPTSIFSRKNKVPACPPKPLCYLLVPATCGWNQIEAVERGFAITKDFVFQGFTSNVPKELDPEYLRPKVPAGC